MLTKEVKKGDRVLLKNGWYATVLDNGKGSTRFCEVEGFYTEMGSVYSYDFDSVLKDGKWVPIEYTKKELELKKMVEGIF